MKVLVSGGGTAGHVTPTLAVIDALKHIDPDIKVVFVAQRGDATVDIVRSYSKQLSIRYIRAGKLRRFHSYSKIKQLLNVPMVLKNVRDFGLFGIGTLQAWRIIGQEKPDVVFIKGGYVGLPVGIAAKRRGVPIVTHDSDAVPGLTNRILSRWATYCAVTMPKGQYDYPKKKMVVTGLPVSNQFATLANAAKQSLRTELGLQSRDPLLLIVPGSSGSKTVNDAVVDIMPVLLKSQKVTVVHITGAKHLDDVKAAYKAAKVPQQSIILRPFVHNLPEYTRAADVIVTRAGSTLIELAAQSCAVVSVPNPYLTGGHQLKNAAIYKAAKAISVVSDTELERNSKVLLNAVSGLLVSRTQREALGKALHAFYLPDAAQKIAALLIKAAELHE